MGLIAKVRVCLIVTIPYETGRRTEERKAKGGKGTEGISNVYVAKFISFSFGTTPKRGEDKHVT
jgi:hypothetical protein